MYKGLASGATLYTSILVPNLEFTVVLREVVFYCGDPSAAVSNSIVVTCQFGYGEGATIAAYDSGTTSSVNPIFVRQSANTIFENIGPYSDTYTNIYNVVNTSESEASWDVTISGWVIQGKNTVEMANNT